MKPKFLSGVDLESSVKAEQVAEQIAEIKLQYATSTHILRSRVFTSVNLASLQLLFSQ